MRHSEKIREIEKKFSRWEAVEAPFTGECELYMVYSVFEDQELEIIPSADLSKVIFRFIQHFTQGDTYEYQVPLYRISEIDCSEWALPLHYQLEDLELTYSDRCCNYEHATMSHSEFISHEI